jgi:hypothetical protein
MASLVMAVNDAVTGSGANNVYMAGNLSVGTTASSYRLHVGGDIYANGGWLRSSGDAGWYSETWGGGWHMSDAQWIRAYNNKDVYTAGSMRADAQVFTGGQNSVFKYTNVGQFSGAASFAFSDFGVLIENAYSESGGFQANGNNAYIWSPGDADLVRFYDEDGMSLSSYIDGWGDYYSTSDINKKQSINKIENALPIILSLNGYNFEYTLHPDEIKKGQSPETTAGVIAQEVDLVIPEIVDHHDNDGLYINYDGLIPYLIEAIKEQQVMIEDLQKQIDKLRQANEEKTE